MVFMLLEQSFQLRRLSLLRLFNRIHKPPHLVNIQPRPVLLQSRHAIFEILQICAPFQSLGQSLQIIGGFRHGSNRRFIRAGSLDNRAVRPRLRLPAFARS